MWTKAQIYMMNGIGVYKETKKGKSYAKSDPEVGVVHGPIPWLDQLFTYAYQTAHQSRQRQLA